VNLLVKRSAGLSTSRPGRPCRIYRQPQPETPDELWIVEHPPVYTLGQAGKPEHLLRYRHPIVKIDRGGQVTYHGPGQVVIYLLLDLQPPEDQGTRTGHRHRAGGHRFSRQPWASLPSATPVRRAFMSVKPKSPRSA
jgi:hypothetical protein